MLGFEYRWLLLNPVMRGAFLSLALAALCASYLFREAACTPPPPPAPVLLVESAPAETEADWPRAALRLWFLLPLSPT